MTLTELCSLFDRYEIVETQTQIDRRYYATTETAYSDGKIESTVGNDAYIHINSVHNATYLMFVDIEHKIYLCVYKYIPNSKYKVIRQQLQILKNIINKLNNIDEYNDIDALDNHIDDDVIDINTFTCTECDSEERLVFNRSKTNPEAITTKCKTCKTEYVFVPSKYYKLSSKKITYFKSEKSSRQISITQPTG